MRALVTVVAGLLLAVGAVGCSSAQDTAQNAADAAKSKASDEVRKQVETKICDLVKDQRLSDSDRQKLATLVEQAKKINLPDEIVEPAQDLLDKGQSAKADITALRSRCSFD